MTAPSEVSTARVCLCCGREMDQAKLQSAAAEHHRAEVLGLDYEVHSLLAGHLLREEVEHVTAQVLDAVSPPFPHRRAAA